METGNKRTYDENGWIKLHRCIQDNELYRRERFTWMQAWVDLLLLATHKRQAVFIRGIQVMLNPGELCYSQLSLAKRWRWNRKTVMAFLDDMKLRDMLDTRSDNVTTVISIRNWKKYQVKDTRADTRADTKTDTRISGGTDTKTNDETAQIPHENEETGLGECWALDTKANPPKPETADTNKKYKKKDSSILTEAERMYEYYASRVRSGARSDAVRSITKRLKEYTADDLTRCIDNYARNGMSPDTQYRVQANNFFGRAERFREYLAPRNPEAERHGNEPTEFQRILRGEGA